MLNGLLARHAVPLALVERDTDLTAMRSLAGYPALKRKLTDTGDDEIED
jgi:hypothetical protein